MSKVKPVNERVLEVLRASGVFGLLGDEVLQDLCQLLELQHVPGGKIVYREGEQANTMFFLVSGRLRVSRRDKNGALQLYNEIRPGESVGEAGLILQQPRAADITALRDSIIAMLSRADFERLLALHPLPLNKVFAQAIYNHLRHSSQVVERRHAQIFHISPGKPFGTLSPLASTHLTSTPSIALPDVVAIISASSLGRQIDTKPQASVKP